jgi:hypothetical protein
MDYGKVYINEVSSGIYMINYVSSTNGVGRLSLEHNCAEDEYINVDKVIAIMNDKKLEVVLEREGKEDIKIRC